MIAKKEYQWNDAVYRSGDICDKVYIIH